MGRTRAGLSDAYVECVETANALNLPLEGTEEEREKAVTEYLWPLFKPYIEESGLTYDEWDYSEDLTDSETYTFLKNCIFPADCQKLSTFASLSQWAKGNEWKALVWICLSANEGMSNTSMPMWC